MGETDHDMARTRDDQGRRILGPPASCSRRRAGALSVRRIATAAGCSTMGLYSRFGSKDGVVDELFAEGFEHLCQAMSALPTTAGAVADLRACAMTYASRRSRGDALHGHVRETVPGFVPSREPRHRARRLRGWWHGCSAASTPAAFRGAVDIAEVVWGSIHGLVMLELVGSTPPGPARRHATPRARHPLRGTPSARGGRSSPLTTRSTDGDFPAPERPSPRSSRALDRVFDNRSTSTPPTSSSAGRHGTDRQRSGTGATSLRRSSPRLLARRAIRLAGTSSRWPSAAAVVEDAEGRHRLDPDRAAAQHDVAAGCARCNCCRRT